jgi:hypothetical protein
MQMSCSQPPSRFGGLDQSLPKQLRIQYVSIEYAELMPALVTVVILDSSPWAHRYRVQFGGGTITVMSIKALTIALFQFSTDERT